VADFQDNYSFIDKALHYFAFNTSKVQRAMASQESQEYEDNLRLQHIEKPIFITSLPRSGTTILLNILATTDQFCYHAYQDMPFIFTPLIWAKFSRFFTQKGEFQERAHQDGIRINQHSPEAFEEMLWKSFWPAAYLHSAISPWPKEDNKDFDKFFVEHIKKLMLRDGQNYKGGKRRYLSKNNLNITRLPYIKTLFPDSLIIIPFREPLQHAMSLLNQHRNFIALHKNNTFAKHYMAAIGHFDFGANLKPINFNNWFFDTSFKPDSLDFWLEYWIQTYQYLIQSDETSHFFIDFDELCHNPQTSLKYLADHLLIEPKPLSTSIPIIKIAKKHTIDTRTLTQENIDKSRVIYRQLLNISAHNIKKNG